MQTTYRKQTAAAILKTARIEVMRAGNAEILVNIPGVKTPAIALLGTRQSGWGDTVRDVLVLTEIEDGQPGRNVRLATTPRSLAKLESLHAECERVQGIENAKDDNGR